MEGQGTGGKGGNPWGSDNNIRILKRDAPSRAWNKKFEPLLPSPESSAWPSLPSTISSEERLPPKQKILFSKIAGSSAHKAGASEVVSNSALVTEASPGDEVAKEQWADGPEGWIAVGGEKDEAGLEEQRERRRQKRHQQKAAKRLAKEERKAQEIRAPKGLHVQVLDVKTFEAAVGAKAPDFVTSKEASAESSCFPNDEYPALDEEPIVKAKKVVVGRKSEGQQSLVTGTLQECTETSALPGQPGDEMAKMKEDEGLEGWITVGEEKDEAELDAQRERRKQRRRQEKAAKRLAKEERKAQEIRAPKGLHIRVMDVKSFEAATKSIAPGSSAATEPVARGIRFLDDEYPALHDDPKPKAKDIVIWRQAKDQYGKVMGDAESASEWETDDEEKGSVSRSKPKSSPKGTQLSYSAMAAKEKAKKQAAVPLAKPMKGTKPNEPPKKVKVKSRDPITFDLMSALAKKEEKFNPKPARVITSKPQIIRGKERETPKKKRPTKIRRIILADRLLRKRVKEYLDARKKGKASKGEHEAVEMPEDKAGTVAGEASKESHEGGKDGEQEILEEVEKRSESAQSDLEKAKSRLHNRKFAPYCHHSLSKKLDELVRRLMSDLIRFQDRLHAEDPVKAKQKRRYVVGLRETHKLLNMNRLSGIILAPNIEAVKSSGGLNDAVDGLLRSSKLVDADGVVVRDVPVFFTLDRWKLGKACFRNVPVACIGILNYQGSDENFRAMKELLPKLKSDYQERLQGELEAGRRNDNKTAGPLLCSSSSSNCDENGTVCQAKP